MISAVLNMSCPSFLDGLRDGRLMAVQQLLCRGLLQIDPLLKPEQVLSDGIPR